MEVNVFYKNNSCSEVSIGSLLLSQQGSLHQFIYDFKSKDCICVAVRDGGWTLYFKKKIKQWSNKSIWGASKNPFTRLTSGKMLCLQTFISVS